MKAVTGVAGAVVAVAATLVLTWMSQMPMPPAGPTDAVVRLSWRARPERIEECRPPGAEELAGLPAHMRQTLICDGNTASYRLEVQHDGRTLVDDLVRGGGLRHDRPIHVLRELRVPAGEALVRVQFERAGVAGTPPAVDAADEAAPPSGDPAGPGRVDQAVPARLVLERRLPLLPRTVTLVTYDPASRALVVVGAPAEAGGN